MIKFDFEMILFLIFLVLQFFIFYNKRSLAFIFVIIQLVSVIGSFFLGVEVEIETIEEYSFIFIMLLLLYLIISPWRSYSGIEKIASIEQEKLYLITRFLILVNVICFVILLTIVIIVQTLVENVNEFKYVAGVNHTFIENNLPFPRIFFSFAIVFSNFAYFLLPLHFYYLHKNKNRLAIICLILSLNIILLGLTYFSRAVVVQYLFLYVALLYAFYGTISKNSKRVMKKTFFVMGGILLIYFIDISIKISIR
ncbi:hypothetical protein L950_0203810 [Sphingobacterium sp. IITKGP-BTPF85]|nr:hypothetical protein L950_0203810 [Sphingobacterium sp. IITKGP-BTPF85]